MKKWLLIASVLFAPLAQAELKIGVVKLPVLMQHAYQSHPENATIKAKRQEGKRLLDAKERELRGLESQLASDQSGLSTDQRVKVSLRIKALRREAQGIQDGFNDELKAISVRVEGDSVRKIQEALVKFARDNSYDIIFPVGSQGALYASPRADVTPQVQALMR